MEAVVTLKATTQELDLVRRALGTHIVQQQRIIDGGVPREARAARQELLTTKGLLDQLGGQQ